MNIPRVFAIWLRTKTTATTSVQATIPATDASSVLRPSYEVFDADDAFYTRILEFAANSISS